MGLSQTEASVPSWEQSEEWRNSLQRGGHLATDSFLRKDVNTSTDNLLQELNKKYAIKNGQIDTS